MAKTVILGGNGGIGSAIARRLRAQRRDVVLVGRNREALTALGAELDCHSVIADVTEPEQVQRAMADLAQSGPIDGLAYAVGTITVKPLTQLTSEDILHDFSVNALGAALALQALGPCLRASDQASVVLFSSVAVAQGFTGHASIAMAKAAVEGLTLSMAAEWAPKVRVNCIAPSLTRTPLAAALTANENLAKAVADLHALRRLGEADDIAALAVFLLSADAGWITGQVIGVDGGRSALRTLG